MPSISTARITYLWSWGPIVGPVDDLRSVKLNGTPVKAADGTINYPSVKWQFRSGELNQERLEGIQESSNEIDVKKELIYGTPWLYTITNSMSDAARIRLSWPTLRSQDAAGNINGVRIDYAVDISTDNGPYVEVLVSAVDRKNITEYERAHRLELPAGTRWTIPRPPPDPKCKLRHGCRSDDRQGNCRGGRQRSGIPAHRRQLS